MLAARNSLNLFKNSIAKRNLSTSYMFDKGRITLEKMKEKVTEENSID